MPSASDNRNYVIRGFALKTAFDPKIRLTESGPESDALGLRFDSHDDALNYIDKLTQHCQNFLSSNKLDFVESYKKGQIVIKLEFVSRRDLRQYQLLFIAIPSGRAEDISAHSKPLHLMDDIRKHYGAKDAVLVSIRKDVQCPKEIVPSLVWLTPAYDLPNFLRQFSATSIKGALKLGDISTDRKVSRMCGQRTEGVNGTDSLIQSMSKVDRSVAGMTPQKEWHGFSQLELDHLPDGITAFLHENGASVVVAHEGGDFSIKFGNVMLCPSDTEL